MTLHVNIHEAKARLSHLIELALQGEEVQICKRNVPLVVFAPVALPPKKKRPLGLSQGEFSVPDSFFEPLSEDELGMSFHGIFPDK